MGWVDVLVLCLLACGAPLAVPYVSNQNQYLAHVASQPGSPLAQDWFVSTVDPYPLFSAVMGAMLDVGGFAGLRLAAFTATLVALCAVFWLAHQLSPAGCGRSVPLGATTLVGATLLKVPFDLPTPWLDAAAQLSAFHGLAGQYVISKPAYVQPSVVGALVLLAFPAWMAARQTEPGHRRPFVLLAVALASAGCMLHPTYLVAVAIGLGAAMLVDAARRDLLALGATVGAGLVVLGATLVANPGLLAIATASGESALALERFAFERIPHHTLYPSWENSDVLLLVVLSLAVLVLLVRRQRWLALWFVVALGVALVSALVVEVTRLTDLALLFPWRISVLLVPIAATVIAVELAAGAWRLIGDWLRWIALVAATAVALTGLHATWAAVSPSVSDPATALVRASGVTGVGLVPLEMSNIRLNAPAAVYVDWKSPPYAGTDLVEWWERVDEARSVAAAPETFCSADWSAGIDWVLLRSRQPAPTCTASWVTAGESGGWRVLARR